MNLRPNTHDDYIYNQVVVKNEYQLPATMLGLRVLDIGAHIGCFSMACLMRGATVTAYEPHPDNFKCLRGNLNHPKFTAINAAVTPKPNVSINKDFPMWNGKPNTGGLRTGDEGYAVEGIHPNVVLSTSYDLMKLDCEGDEWAILASVNPELLPKRVIGEYHEVDGHTVGEMKVFFENQGYNFFYTRPYVDVPLGLFWATK